MRTLVLLTSLFLLALLVQAEPLPEKAEDAPEEKQSEEEELDMTFEGAERSGLQHRDQILTCRCKFGSCRPPETKYGTCYKNGKMARRCCS
ncbi:neutrophil antibiotic peptide NP-3B-like [Cavia porcellus]|uniref:neutrophil antibiotic peptide NP-3B-like n=1 Tax=Cavia porcellus TaxID=10141 RepID=UPI002FE3ED37